MDHAVAEPSLPASNSSPRRTRSGRAGSAPPTTTDAMGRFGDCDHRRPISDRNKCIWTPVITDNPFQTGNRYVWAIVITNDPSI
jgi:hypothetical protein